MKLEELLDKYEVENPEEFHRDMLFYYNILKHPELSEITESKWLSIYELEICKRYKIQYPTFVRNLEFLEFYQMTVGEATT